MLRALGALLQPLQRHRILPEIDPVLVLKTLRKLVDDDARAEHLVPGQRGGEITIPYRWVRSPWQHVFRYFRQAFHIHIVLLFLRHLPSLLKVNCQELTLQKVRFPCILQTWP